MTWSVAVRIYDLVDRNDVTNMSESSEGTVPFVPYVFLGHPRCGSASLAAGLAQAGLAVAHETLDKDGIVSWWHTGFFKKANDQKLFRHGKAGIKQFRAGRVLHYLRDPIDAIPSIEIENEFKDRQNNSFRYRRNVIYRTFKVDLAGMDRTSAAVASYIYWNRMAETASDIDEPILVERPNLALVRSDLSVASLPVHNTTARKYRVEKTSTSLSQILTNIAADLRTEFFELVARHYPQHITNNQPKVELPTSESANVPIIPPEAVPYVIRQRTRLQRLISKEYYDVMLAEYASLKSYLPQKVERILDIGGGLGGVNIHLSRHYGHAVGIDMLDRVGMDHDMKFGFQVSAEKSNDPELSKAYMKAGGMPIENFTFWDVDGNGPIVTACLRLA